MIYLDNAATSFPKAPGVSDRMKYYIDQVGVSINRGVYAPAQEAGLQTLTLREQLCDLFHHSDPTHVILTGGATAALNLAIKGSLKPGDHVLVSSMEHNAVMRPLVQLGIDFDRIPSDHEGVMDISAIEGMIRENTRLFVLSHASNVCGTVQDVAAVGEICRKHNIPLVLDAAQSAGHIPVDFAAFGLSALAIPAHKGLLGPQGIGALLVTAEFARTMSPLIAGGTGSMSDSEELPPYMPDRFESGTPNLPGIYGWSGAMDYVNRVGVEKIHEREQALTCRFLQAVKDLPKVRVVGRLTDEGRVSVISLDFAELDNAEASDRLEQEFGILTRCGLHCAPSAHKSLGTFPRGTVRFSFGPWTTEAEVDAAAAAVAQIAL